MNKSVVFAVMIGISTVSMPSVFGMNFQELSSERFKDQKYPIHAACPNIDPETEEFLIMTTIYNNEEAPFQEKR